MIWFKKFYNTAGGMEISSPPNHFAIEEAKNVFPIFDFQLNNYFSKWNVRPLYEDYHHVITVRPNCHYLTKVCFTIDCCCRR